MNIMFGIPTYSGDFDMEFHLSVVNSMKQFKDIHFEHSIHKNTWVASARNNIVENFLERDYLTHLLLLDDDITWTTQDISELLKYGQDLDVVGGLYPKKDIDHDSILDAYNQGCPKDKLHNFTGLIDNSMFDPVYNNYDLTKPIEVKKLATGFTLVKREVFENIKENYPDNYYRRNGRDLFLYFDTQLVKHEDGVQYYYGNDTYFCKLCRDIGYKVYLLPWTNPSHIGKFKYERKIFL